MRKEVIGEAAGRAASQTVRWMNLDTLAKVQISSEGKEFPIEAALLDGKNKGWRAATAGKQMIRLVFEKPQQVHRLWLVMEEQEKWRTQQFVLRWSADKGRTFQEIVRQQWNFSPPNAIRENRRLHRAAQRGDRFGIRDRARPKRWRRAGIHSRMASSVEIHPRQQ